MSCAMPATFCGAESHHQLVVLRVVGDVAGDVVLLDAADAVLEARRARHAPTAARASAGSRRYGRSSLGVGSVANSTSICGSVVDVREQPRLRAVREVAVAQQIHRRPVLERDARTPRSPRRSSRPAPARARTGTGDSPLRPYSACRGRPARSSSAGRSTGRRAGRRRSRAAARSSWRGRSPPP